MVGRERELEAGRRFLAAVEAGPALLVFEGEAGIGKTTVWKATVALAEQHGYTLLVSRPAAAEAKLSYSGLADLLEGVDPAVLEELPGPQRAALEVALLQAAPGLNPPEPRAVFTAFSSILSDLSLRGPVVIAVDDLQWLDRPSQAALEFVVRRLQQGRIGLLASLRVGTDATPASTLARALDEARAERSLIGPLSVAVLHDVIHDRLGLHLARPVLVRISSLARGNPFYALEIAGEIQRKGRSGPGEILPLPDDLLALVSARIRRLPAATRDALLLASTLREPVLGVLDRSALYKAEDARLVQIIGDRIAFSHPLVASAAYSSASTRRRRESHRQAAEMTVGEERARHLALAADGPSEEIAAALETAAEQVRVRGAPAAAAELLELAIELTPTGRSGAERDRTLSAAESHFHAGDLARARMLAENVLVDLPPGPGRGRALRVLGEIRYHLDSFVEAIPLLEQALQELGDDAKRIDVRANLTYAHFATGGLKIASQHAQLAETEAQAANDQDLYACALAMSATIEFIIGRPLQEDRIELALELEDLDRQLPMSMRPSYLAAVIAVPRDDHDRAVELLSRLATRALERGEDGDLPFVYPYLGFVERRRGNIRKALEYADQGHEIARTLGSHTMQAMILAERSYCLATLGEVDAARADAEAATELLKSVEYYHADFWVNLAIRFLDLSTGAARPNQVLDGLAAVVEALMKCDPMVALVLPDTIEVFTALGQLERAEVLTRVLVKYGQERSQPVALAASARCRALVEAARGELATAVAAADQATTLFERAHMPLDQARSLLLKGQIERRSKRKRAARESLQMALEIFDSLEARLWSEKARAELARTGGEKSGHGELTPTEERVAHLCAQGLTVRQIADTAFLSPKTVEANLTRIYQKLGIRSRAELGRVMAERGHALSIGDA